MEDHGTVYATRFKRMRELIEAMNEIWTKEKAEYHGEFVNFDPMIARPKPVHKPHPPIQEAGRDPASIEITSFGLGEDLDRVKRLVEMGVARVVPMFPPETADTVLPIIDRWTKIIRGESMAS